MFQLNLSAVEKNVLKGVLESDLSELHRELADTDNWKLKEALREKQTTLIKIFESLESMRDGAVISGDVTP